MKCEFQLVFNDNQYCPMSRMIYIVIKQCVHGINF